MKKPDSILQRKVLTSTSKVYFDEEMIAISTLFVKRKEKFNVGTSF